MIYDFTNRKRNSSCPCGNCDHRHEACWGTCPDYKAYREKVNQANRNKWEEEQRYAMSNSKRKWLIRKARSGR